VRTTISSRRLAACRTLCLTLLASISIIFAVIAPSLNAQTETPERKILYRIEPEYPPELKRVGIGGYVRVDATVSASGAVEAATVLGGNPILGEAAVKAIKKWKYEPTNSRTKAKLVFHFSP